MRRRVVVTGIGCVTPLGTEIETIWRRRLAGESGVGLTTLFDASNFPTKFSAELASLGLEIVSVKQDAAARGLTGPSALITLPPRTMNRLE